MLPFENPRLNDRTYFPCESTAVQLTNETVEGVEDQPRPSRLIPTLHAFIGCSTDIHTLMRPQQPQWWSTMFPTT